MRWSDTLELPKARLAWPKSEAKLAKERGENVVLVTHHDPLIEAALVSICATMFQPDFLQT